ncbi:MAG: outer membrane protein [Pedosphaera sp.]|nr:outer membrane protein [Pedosphaera sp.]
MSKTSQFSMQWHPIESRLLFQAVLLALLFHASRAASQAPPTSPAHPWHSPQEYEFAREAEPFRYPALPFDPSKTYSLAELVDLAETRNPETRVAWEQARDQASSLGITRSELYPALAAVALSQINRSQVFFGTNFFPQTIGEIEGGLELNYTVFDFGARSGRISAAKAQLLAANFAFNDTHRRIIYQVEQACYRLLNDAGQIAAAEASLTNALTVQQAAEDRMQHELATLPDVLEARSAAAQAQYELQAVLGAEQISRGNLARALGILPTVLIRTQPLEQLSIPDSISDTVEQALDRAFAQRPDLMQRLAEVRSAQARIKEARAAFYPTLNLNATGSGQSLHGTQSSLPWVHTSQLNGSVGLSLTWSLFDGGARRNQLAKEKADARASAARVQASRDEVADEVWTAYSNLQTALRQRQAALALLTAAVQSYSAALESYNNGLRNLLDVTAAQRTLALARSTDVLARTEVLSALAELAFRTGDSIQPPGRRKGGP